MLKGLSLLHHILIGEEHQSVPSITALFLQEPYCLLIRRLKAHWHYNSGARVQALGARMRRAFDNVGAMQSTVTGVVTNSDFTPAPYKMMGKAT